MIIEPEGQGFNQRTYVFNMDELVELVNDAIGELTNLNCPHCESYIGADRYLDNKDIKKYLLSRLGG